MDVNVVKEKSSRTCVRWARRPSGSCPCTACVARAGARWIRDDELLEVTPQSLPPAQAGPRREHAAALLAEAGRVTPGRNRRPEPRSPALRGLRAGGDKNPLKRTHFRPMTEGGAANPLMAYSHSNPAHGANGTDGPAHAGGAIGYLLSETRSSAAKAGSCCSGSRRSCCSR